MRKARLALTALMIGTMSLTSVAYAEANVLDSVKLVLNIGTETKKAPSHQEKPESPRKPEHKSAPKPVMEHGTKQEPKQPEHKPAPKPVMTHEPQRGPKHEPEHHENHKKDVPQPRPEQR